MEEAILGKKERAKSPKQTPYLEFQLKVGLDRATLARWAELAARSGVRPKAQKLFKTNQYSGKEEVDMKGIAGWLRDVVVPDYISNLWHMEQAKAQAIKQIAEGKDALRKLRIPENEIQVYIRS